MPIDSLTHSGSVIVACPPDELYVMVSDITRMGEWSPICKECWWDDGGGPRVGAWFTGRNVLPERTWEFLPSGMEMFRERFGDDADAQIADRYEKAKAGIPETLAAIKRAAEA